MSLEETKFPFVSGYQLEIASGADMGRVSISFSSRAHISETCEVPVQAATVSVCSHVHWSCCCRGPYFLVSSVPSGYYTLSVTSSKVFPESSGGRGWYEADIPFRTECSKIFPPSLSLPLSFCTMSGCGFLHLFPSTTGKRFSDDDWAKQICEYRKMSLGVPLLLFPKIF